MIHGNEEEKHGIMRMGCFAQTKLVRHWDPFLLDVDESLPLIFRKRKLTFYRMPQI